MSPSEDPPPPEVMTRTITMTTMIRMNISIIFRQSDLLYSEEYWHLFAEQKASVQSMTSYKEALQDVLQH